MTFNQKALWTEYPLVAFDTETSGAYPLEAQIIELGAVKWFQGQVIDQFQVLIKPNKPLVASNMAIHGITNEMLLDTEPVSAHIQNFYNFVDQSILIAHHAPFDLGFIAIDFENELGKFPNCELLCTSLISRALLPTTNHKLQTLIKELGLIGGSAHRAYDDAYACLQVFQKCVEKLDKPTLEELKRIQKKPLYWNLYSLKNSNQKVLDTLIEAIKKNKIVEILWNKSETRQIKPFGIVRNPDGDYVNALCLKDQSRKRFTLSKITEAEIIF